MRDKHHRGDDHHRDHQAFAQQQPRGFIEEVGHPIAGTTLRIDSDTRLVHRIRKDVGLGQRLSWIVWVEISRWFKINRHHEAQNTGQGV
uniref:hypothetical protein n=1 Tax=Novipirellula artificiosorum TaxID=2528016 RepID=UPI0011B543D1|nr:hypothetical protein [Novipirellula artificiosorum]